MNFDFALLLVILTGVTGLIWLADSLLFAGKRREKAVLTASSLATTGNGVTGADAVDDIASAKSGDSAPTDDAYKEPVLVEYARSFFPVLLVVLVLRSFLFEPFRIPSGSMLPTLLIGDFILVNKFSYGVRLPVIDTKILEIGSPERGDVAVFRFPENPDIDFIKRVVGLPGDKISYRDKRLTINGEPVPLAKLGPYLPPGEERADQSLLRLTEKFEAVDHDILVSTRTVGVQGDYTVPEGHYFVMGDNRDNSNDSRFWGSVPEDHLVGKAILIWMNLDFHWNRLGSSIN